ncbi:MAG: methionine--tRNA ligase [Alphaproteobacteria bacterium]
MTGKPAYYITTPIYYVNDSPHIGHAYTSIASDVMARFKRLDGHDVFFLTGTDEHGQKVEQAAARAGVDPQTFADRVSQNFRDLTGILNLSNDDFIRTTEARHTRAAQALWQRMVESGDIYLGTYAGWYSVRDEAFYAENELSEGEGGRKIAPSGAEVEWVEEPSYFFRLSAWSERLLAHYKAHPEAIGPDSRRNEVLSFIASGLRDLSISRTSFSWGVEVPGDEKHIIYVWLDALINYLTAVNFPDTDDPLYRTYWPAALHMVGKDIIRFHAVYWPAFLMAAGLAPPQRVFAHGWWTNEGQKISKSLGNVIDPLDLIKEYGLDQVRYFVLREVPFGQDGDFSPDAMVRRINTDLANDLGNLCQRVLSMVAKNCEGAVPTPGNFTAADSELLATAGGLLDRLRPEFDRQAFHKALELIWQTVGDANRYIDEQAPWALRKTEPARMATVLYVLAEVIRHLGILVQPFMPESGQMILEQLAVPRDARQFATLESDRLIPGRELPRPRPVFPRYEVVDEGAA